jgi:hypothetical protein
MTKTYLIVTFSLVFLFIGVAGATYVDVTGDFGSFDWSATR